jgi:AcrR family transcriptional regulator
LETTVEQITEAADVGKGTFFNYFSSKEQVLVSLAQAHFGGLVDALAHSWNKKESIFQALRTFSDGIGEEFRQSPNLVRSLVAALSSSEALRQLMVGHVSRARELLAELIWLGQQRGEVRLDREPNELALSFQQSLVGALLLWSVNPVPTLSTVLRGVVDQFRIGHKMPTVGKPGHE